MTPSLMLRRIASAPPFDLLLFPRDDVRPQRFDVVGFEHIAPRRHVAHAVGHGIDEARVILARKLAQILRPLRVGEARPVAGLAVGFVETRAFADLLLSERFSVLRRGARAGEREDQGAPMSCHQSGINANVHTEPPAGTLSVTSRLATLPPR